MQQRCFLKHLGHQTAPYQLDPHQTQQQSIIFEYCNLQREKTESSIHQQ